MNKVFQYLRISSKDQNEARQIEAMNKWNKENNITNAIQLIDKASGTNTNRKQLQLLLEVVGEDDLVVIKSIDRLSRNYKECKQLWEEITSKGADIVVIDMPMLDTRQYKDLLGNFISDLILSVLGYVAEQETEFRKQRQDEGIKAMPINEQGKKVSLKTGRPTGRPNAEYPKNWEKEYKLWKEGTQTAKVTMDNLGLKRTTFYKLVKQYEETNSEETTVITKKPRNIYNKDLHKLSIKELKQRISLKEGIIKSQNVKESSGIYKEYEILVNRLKELEG